MIKRCIVVSSDFNFVSPIKNYWFNYDNPLARLFSLHLGGDFHKELRVRQGKLRIIGSPILLGQTVERETEEGYHYVDGARLCDIESPLDFPDSIIISERDGWVEDVLDSDAYLKTFDGRSIISIVHVDRMRRERDSL